MNIFDTDDVVTCGIDQNWLIRRLYFRDISGNADTRSRFCVMQIGRLDCSLRMSVQTSFSNAQHLLRNICTKATTRDRAGNIWSCEVISEGVVRLEKLRNW